MCGVVEKQVLMTPTYVHVNFRLQLYILPPEAMDYRHILTELKGRAAAFKERDTHPDTYKKSCNALQQTIKEAKGQDRIKI